MKVSSRHTVLLLATFMLAGCANWFNAAERQAEAEKKAAVREVVPIARETMTTPREPGSIWSESSSWNALYSPPAQRMVGDVVVLRPSDSFRLTVAHRAGSGPGWEAVQGGKENSQILAVIREVMGRQVYRVEAKQSIKVGVRDQEIELNAKVREQDLASDDSSSTDNLFDIALKVEGENKELAEQPAKPVAARGIASVSPETTKESPKSHDRKEGANKNAANEEGERS